MTGAISVTDRTCNEPAPRCVETGKWRPAVAIAEYRSVVVGDLLSRIFLDGIESCVEIVSLPDVVRGYKRSSWQMSPAT